MQSRTNSLAWIDFDFFGYWLLAFGKKLRNIIHYILIHIRSNYLSKQNGLYEHKIQSRKLKQN